jgi:hypothetical protein
MEQAMSNRIAQAYRQAPWRIQVQWIGLFALGLLLVALVAGFYLNITTRAAIAGHDLQNMLYQVQNEESDIAGLNTQLASITSASTMEKRAHDLGFIPIEAGQPKYLEVPGYVPLGMPNLAPPPDNGVVEAPLILPDYTQSLWDWLFRSFLPTQVKPGTMQP